MARNPANRSPDTGLYSLPGLTLPLNHHPITKIPTHHPQRHKPDPDAHAPLFPNALHVQDMADGYSLLPLKTIRELTMLRLMDHITDKKAWEKKVLKEAIVTKWREELQTAPQDVSPKMLDWIIAELRDKATFYAQTGGVVISYEFGIVKSDTAVPEATRRALVDAVRRLEETTPVDYHPGSDGKVIDLVHPSLFPLVYGRTRVLRNSTLVREDCLSGTPGQGEVIPVPAEEEAQLPPPKPDYVDYSSLKSIPNPYSRRFQWLPCDVVLTRPGPGPGSASASVGCTITSYINNLHPQQHAGLYALIEEVLACAVPLWGWTLGPLDGRNATALDDGPGSLLHYADGSVYFPGWPPDRVVCREIKYKNLEPERGRRYVADDVVRPDPVPLEYRPWSAPFLDLRMHYTSLQVIIKLANIELTPEKPEYEGGSWHVEGQLNEHICATALYYYSNENVTDSHLSFRQETSWNTIPSHRPGQIDPWIGALYNCADHGPRVQEIMAVACREGRLLTFPNIFQHRVQPFRLRDRTRRGHRKILALFLVDPNIAVISTGNVPPQDEGWWGGGGGAGAEGVMSLQEAKELRVELMAERSVFVGAQDAAFQSLRFNLCEH
ncbi:DUF4246 domain-containing protein [Aspergillus lucknowensis]|uniref:Uncharacterized protein n=1 Tax=Aspergillus lucknowensis TaxID=176173 RepID=A0ABR4LY40_9EURO